MRVCRAASLALLFPFIFAAECTPPGDDPDGEVVLTDDPLGGPSVKVQVIDIEPPVVAPGAPFRAVIFGSAFENGATVTIGGQGTAQTDLRDPNTLAVHMNALPPGIHDIVVRNPDEATATLRGGLEARAGMLANAAAGLDCQRITVAFEFDSFQLSTEGQAVLSEHLACFQARTGTVRLEGHADERGTTEYNLALGERRAGAVQRWLTMQGVLPGRLKSVTYGEERPADSGHGDQAWARNRRVEIVVSG